MSIDNAYLGSASRRRLLTATPGSLLWALAGGLGAGAQIATAQPLQAGAVPEVDRLAVRVVTDSYHHAFEASRTSRAPCSTSGACRCICSPAAPKSSARC